MSQNTLLNNIAETVGEAAKQGANEALQNLASTDLVQTAVAGAHNGINQLTTTVTFTTPGASGAATAAPRNLTTTTSPNRVTFNASGNPVTTDTSLLAPGPRDSDNRLYVFGGNYTPPGGNDDPNAIAQQLAQEKPLFTDDPFQDALLYGPAELRQRPVIPNAVTIPLNSGNVAQGVDDGKKPQATPPAPIYGARVVKEDGGGWPAGIIIEDRSKYGPQGEEAKDTIPASVVTAIVGDNAAFSVGWFVRIALALALLLLLLYIIKRVIQDVQNKKMVKEQQATMMKQLETK